jgi:hypothetical protein
MQGYWPSRAILVSPDFFTDPGSDFYLVGLERDPDEQKGKNVCFTPTHTEAY